MPVRQHGEATLETRSVRIRIVDIDVIADARVVLPGFARQPLQLRQASQRLVDPIEVGPARVHTLVLPSGECCGLLGVTRDHRNPLDQLQRLVEGRARLCTRLIYPLVHDFVGKGGWLEGGVRIPELLTLPQCGLHPVDSPVAIRIPCQQSNPRLQERLLHAAAQAVVIGAQPECEIRGRCIEPKKLSVDLPIRDVGDQCCGNAVHARGHPVS